MRGLESTVSKLTDVYQLTYVGRDVLVGNEILTFGSAAKLSCGICGRLLCETFWAPGDGTAEFRIICLDHGLVAWVRRYYLAPRGDGGHRPARLGGSNRKASAEIMREYGHHAHPFESVEAARLALAKEQEALDSVTMVLETYQTLGGRED